MFTKPHPLFPLLIFNKPFDYIPPCFSLVTRLLWPFVHIPRPCRLRYLSIIRRYGRHVRWRFLTNRHTYTLVSVSSSAHCIVFCFCLFFSMLLRLSFFPSVRFALSIFATFETLVFSFNTFFTDRRRVSRPFTPHVYAFKNFFLEVRITVSIPRRLFRKAPSLFQLRSSIVTSHITELFYMFSQLVFVVTLLLKLLKSVVVFFFVFLQMNKRKIFCRCHEIANVVLRFAHSADHCDDKILIVPGFFDPRRTVWGEGEIRDVCWVRVQSLLRLRSIGGVPPPRLSKGILGIINTCPRCYGFRQPRASNRVCWTRELPGTWHHLVSSGHVRQPFDVWSLVCISVTARLAIYFFFFLKRSWRFWKIGLPHVHPSVRFWKFVIIQKPKRSPLLRDYLGLALFFKRYFGNFFLTKKLFYSFHLVTPERTMQIFFSLHIVYSRFYTTGQNIIIYKNNVFNCRPF